MKKETLDKIIFSIVIITTIIMAVKYLFSNFNFDYNDYYIALFLGIIVLYFPIYGIIKKDMMFVYKHYKLEDNRKDFFILILAYLVFSSIMIYNSIKLLYFIY